MPTDFAERRDHAVAHERGVENRGSFVTDHSAQIEALSNRLANFLKNQDRLHDSAFTQFSKHWNEAVESEDRSEEELRDLADTFKWLAAVGDSRNRYRHELEAFVKERELLEQMPREMAVNCLEKSMSSVSSKIESTMPDEVVRRGNGILQLDWMKRSRNNRDSAVVRWRESQSREALDLRDLTASRLEVNGRLTSKDAGTVAGAILAEIKQVRRPLLPNFSFSAEIDTKHAPTELRWRAPEIQREEIERIAVPPFVKRGVVADIDIPNETQLMLEDRDPELAGLMDELICAAARADYDAHQANPKEGSGQAVKSLVAAVAERTRRTVADIASIMAPSLIETSAENSARECNMNKAAIATLLSALNSRS